jgi:spore germination protein YaaH
MRAAGYLTVVSVPAELQDDPTDPWAGAFDFKALGRDADILQLMTYDENGPWGPPGPVAGLNWVEPCAQFAVSVVPASKISLGIPAYGYDWNLTKGTGVQVYWKNIPALIAKVGAVPQWDVASSSPYFSYTAANRASHVVWYENAESIPLKSALAVRYGLAGVSVFALGFEDLTFWEAVSSGLGTGRN